jgi:hypothetical protein
MNTKTKQEMFDVVSTVFCIVAICVFSYFAVDKVGDGFKSYMNSMCEHPRIRMCMQYD